MDPARDTAASAEMATGGPGRPPCDLRQVLNGVWSLLKTGCQWRMLPREFGKWNTGYACGKRWREMGVRAKLRAALRQCARRCQGRQAEPSAGSVDSQSLKGPPSYGGRL